MQNREAELGAQPDADLCDRIVYFGHSAGNDVIMRAVPAGQHEVKLADPRYEEYTTKVAINAGKTTVI